jgi:hypothetical protein
MYVIAALEKNVQEMAAQSGWFEGKKDLEHEILSEEADAAAYAGQLVRARTLTEGAVESAKQADNAEQAASWLLNSAWREALFGDDRLARDQANQALAIAPHSREGEATAAIILARTGDVSRAELLVKDIEQRYATHSVMQTYWLPTIRAQIALTKHDSSTALAELRRAAPLDTLYPQGVLLLPYAVSMVLRGGLHARRAVDPRQRSVAGDSTESRNRSAQRHRPIRKAAIFPHIEQHRLPCRPFPGSQGLPGISTPLE